MSTGRLGAGDTAIQPTIFDAKGDLIVATAADTPARLAVGSANQVLTVDSSTATGLKWAAPAAAGGLTLLSTTTLTGASVTISSISQDYTNLQLVIKNAYNSVADWLFMRLNSDTGTVYYRRRFNVSGTSVSGATSAESRLLLAQMPNASADDRNGAAIVNLYDYTVTTGQQILTVNAFGYDGSANAGNINTVVYDKSAAITSITFAPDAGTMTAGTVLLYGVK